MKMWMKFSLIMLFITITLGSVSASDNILNSENTITAVDPTNYDIGENSINSQVTLYENTENSQVSNTSNIDNISIQNTLSTNNSNLTYNPNIKISLENSLTGEIGENLNVTVHISEDDFQLSTGTVSLNLNNTLYTSQITNGIGELNLTLPQNPGTYLANITYIGLNYYNSIISQVEVKNNNNSSDSTINMNYTTPVGEIGELIPVTVQIFENNMPVQKGIVTINLEDSSYSNNIINGTSILNLPLPEKSGDYKGLIFYRNNGIKYIENITVIVKNNTNQSKTPIITINNYNGVYGIRDYIKGYITDGNGVGLANLTIGLNMTRLSTNESKIYYVKSDDNGCFQRIIELKNGDYTCWGFFNGNDNYTYCESFEAEMTIILLDNERFTDLTLDYNFNGEVNGKLTYFYDKPLINEDIKITITNLDSNTQNIINQVTNSNGEFIFHLTEGESYKVLIEYLGNYIGDIKYLKSSFYLILNF